eukprot:976987-Pyramimonas_sp.AAC.1
MGVQMAGSYRMQAAGISHLQRCHDATNAYYTVRHSAILDCIDSCYAPEDGSFIRDRIVNDTFLLEDETGSFWQQGKRGLFPGDTGATQLFCR